MKNIERLPRPGEYFHLHGGSPSSFASHNRPQRMTQIVKSLSPHGPNLYVYTVRESHATLPLFVSGL